MSATSRVATAVAAGYLLGRTKKLRLAITVGSVLAGGRLAGGGSGNLLRSLADNPQVAELQDQLRGQLLRAAKSAAINVTTNRLESLTDSLREGGAELEGPDDADEPAEDEAPQDQDQDQDQTDQDEAPEDEADQDEAPQDETDQDDDSGDEPQRRPRRSRDGDGSARRGEGTTKRAPAKKSAAKKAPAKKTAKSAADKPAGKKTSARR